MFKIHYMNMDSANLHQQQQEQVNKLVGSTSSSSSSSPLPTQSYSSYGGAAAGGNLAWSTSNNLILNNSLIPNLNGFINQRGNDEFAPDDQMAPQNNLLWASSSKMKEGFSISSSDTNFPKFTEMLSDEHHVDLSEKLLLKTISASGFHHHINGQDQLGDYSNASNYGIRPPGSFSQIYPSINVSSSAFSTSSSLDMNLQALDLLTNARFSNFVAPPAAGFDHHQMQQSSLMNHSCSSPSNNKVVLQQRAATVEAKRSSSLAEASISHTPKKSRLDSCPPLKVRKEKLGDRIAALQQLVAPFGKTDTASVLMEAIGYIQFLQNQVKTLSVPYMKSSRNRSCRPTQGVPNEEGNELETRRDLRSRGLCLVPLSCMSYVANVDGGACEGVWPPPPNFGATSNLR